MKLYISSMYLGIDTKMLTDWIKDHGNKILLICNARDHKEDRKSEELFNEKNKQILEEVGFDVDYLDLQDYFNDSEGLYKLLNEYKSVFVTGGNVFVLRKAYELSGFDKYLLNNKNKDFLYGGYSAGVCILSDTLKGYDLVDPIVNPYNSDEANMSGVGLLDYMICPHYKSDHKECDLVDNMVDYFKENKVKYITLRDGESLDIII